MSHLKQRKNDRQYWDSGYMFGLIELNEFDLKMQNYINSGLNEYIYDLFIESQLKRKMLRAKDRIKMRRKSQ